MLYSFQSPFADLVASGQKKQTIRLNGKRRHIQPGETMQFWTGPYRKGERRRIGEAICSSAKPIKMLFRKLPEARVENIEMGGTELSAAQIEALAKADGFGGADELARYFCRNSIAPRVEANCVLIKWDRLI